MFIAVDTHVIPPLNLFAWKHIKVSWVDRWCLAQTSSPPWRTWQCEEGGQLTFLLHVQEALHRPLARRFVVLVCRAYPLHQLLHFLLGAHKVVPRLCEKAAGSECICREGSSSLSLFLYFKNYLSICFHIVNFFSYVIIPPQKNPNLLSRLVVSRQGEHTVLN